MAKKLIIGKSEWDIADADATEVVGWIREAMANGTTVELTLRDADGRRVTVFLNGAATSHLTLDLELDPRPSEMS